MFNIFLVGSSHYQIDGNKLPSNLQVIKVLFHNIRILNFTLRESASLVYEEINIFWKKAKILIRHKSRCIDKIENLYNEWRKLQKNAGKQTDNQKTKESLFISQFDNLFDFSHNDALIMVNDEVKNFLLNQRKPEHVGFIANIEEIQYGNNRFLML